MKKLIAMGSVIALALPLQAAEVDSVPAKDLAPVNVSGTQQGPVIWRYSKVGNVVLVVGTVQPVPDGLDFPHFGIERGVAGSGAVLGSEGVVVGEGIGLFQGLTLWPSIRKTKLIGDGKTLADVLSPDDLALWSELKARYMPNDRDVEKLKPAYAAWQLYEAALKRSGLKPGSVVAPVVSKAAKQASVPVVDVRYRLKIVDAKRAVKSFEIAPDDDVACLRSTMRGIQGVVQQAPVVSRTWAEGRLPELAEQFASLPRVDPCWSRLTNAAIAKEQGIDLQRVQHEAWLKGLAETTQANSVVFTTAPVRDLLAQEGVAKALVEQGFTLESMTSDHRAPESQASR